jgi:predicted nucleic-acid-binding Zn-ribbon protein
LLVEACTKCGSNDITWLETATFIPYRSGKKSVEQGWPLNLSVCESCGYSELYVKSQDIPQVKELANKQHRLSDAISKGLEVVE